MPRWASSRALTWSASIPPEDNWGRALIAGVIKALRLATRVEDGAVCASACFLLFAAGEPRTAHPNSFIDVHKAADNDDRETYKSREATRAMVEFARQLGVPRSSRSMAGAVKLSGSCFRVLSGPILI